VRVDARNRPPQHEAECHGQDDPLRQEPVEEREACGNRLDLFPSVRRTRRSRVASVDAASAVQQHEEEVVVAPTGSGRELQHADSPGAADRSWPAGISVSESTV
jgi:hypothetical protein